MDQALFITYAKTLARQAPLAALKQG